MHICKIHIFNYGCTHMHTHTDILANKYRYLLVYVCQPIKKKVSLALKKPSGVAINHLFKKNFIIIHFEALVDVN